ncbi:MAG: hypothetical protein KC506_01475 [Nanoarchaeota archaeon]|nr:hypothetical protein [Nanoarchaeota archaeon]
MIHNKTPVTLAEAKEIVDKLEEKQEVKDYLKKFTKLKPDKAKALKEELIALDNIKIREEHLVKLVDFVPKDADDLHKVLPDASLTEEEINAILEITKKY